MGFNMRVKWSLLAIDRISNAAEKWMRNDDNQLGRI